MKNRIFTKLSAIAGPALLLLFLVVSTRSNGAAVSAIATGNWSSTSTWSTGAVPGAGDDITIGSSYTVTLTANVSTTGSLTVTGVLAGVTYTIGVGTNLTVNGTISGSGLSLITLSGTSAVISGGTSGTHGKITATGGVTTTGSGTSIASGSYIDLSSTLTVSNTFINYGTLTLTQTSGNAILGTSTFTNGASATLSIKTAGNPAIGPSVTLTCNASGNYLGNTVIYNGNNQIIKPANYYNLTFSGTGTTSGLVGAVSVANTLSMISENFATSTFLTMNSGSTIAYSATAATGNITGTIANGTVYDITFSGSTRTGPTVTNGNGLRNVTFNLTSGNTLTLAASFTCTGALTINSGSTLNASTFTITLSGATGTFVNNGTFTATSSTVVFSGTTVSISGGTTAFATLTINNTSTVTTSVNISVATALTVNGTLNPGATNPVSGAGTMTGSGTLKVNEAGNTDDYTTQYSMGAATSQTTLLVNFSGAGPQYIATIISPLGFVISNTAGKVTFNANESTGASGTTVNANAILEMNSANTLSGAVGGSGTIRVMHTGSSDFAGNYSGTVTATSLTIDFGGANPQFITTAISAKAFLISNTSGVVTFNANESTTSGTTVNSSAIVSLGSANTLGGAVTGSGTIIVTNTAAGVDNLATQYTGSVAKTTLTVKYTGGGNQQVGAGSYYSITVNNGNTGNTLGGSVTVTNSLVLTSGNLVLGSNNLTINSGATISGYSASSYIQINGTGTVTANNVSTMTIPVGDDYAPVTISGGGGDNYTVSLSPTITGSGGAARTTHAVNLTWKITAAAGGNTPTFTFQWPQSTELTSFDRTNAIVSQRTGPTGVWASLGSAAPATGGNPWNLSGTAKTMTGGVEYDFGIGDATTPLPVKLLDFTATLENKVVELNWATATEINNNYFTIERSADGINFNDIMTKPGAGNSQVVVNYAAYDVQPLAGVSYYRLKQTDFNDASETFKMVSVDNKVSMDNFNIVSASPTLFSDHFTVNYQLPADGDVRIVVVNMLGAVVQDMTVPATSGFNNFEVNNTTGWRSGIYIVQVHYNNWVNYIKVDKAL